MKNKRNAILLIILLAIVSISLIVFMVSVINKKFNIFKFDYKVSNNLVLDEIYKVHYNKIKIESEASDISIKENDEQNIKVVIYGNLEDVKVSDNDNDNELIIISNAKECRGICINRTIAKIEIYVPKDYENKIDISNNYGDINVDKFLSASFDIESDCGDVLVLGARDISIENNYGDIELKEAVAADIKGAAGNIEVGTVNDITLENNLGDTTIDKVTNYLDVQNDCGDIEIDNININKNSNIKNDLGNIKVGSTNKIYIDASNDLGKIDINNNYPKSEIKLEIENDCGDIKVNN